MRTGIAEIGLALVAVCCFAFACFGEGDAPALDMNRFMEAVSAARLVANPPADASADAKLNALRQLEAAMPAIDEPGGPVCAYVRSRSLLQAGKNDEAQVGFAELSGVISVAPEAVWGLVEANAMLPARRISFERCMEDLLPISMWSLARRVYDGRNKRNVPRETGSTPLIPMVFSIGSPKLERVAELYETLGLHGFAWRSYAEAIYTLPAGLARDKIPYEGTWFSPDTADLWARAADNAWKAGESAVAYDYLAKSAIFGPDGQLEKAKATLAAWEAGEDAKQEAVPKEQFQEATEQIAMLYAEINAHPRALEMIRTHPEWVRNPVELEARIADEWKAVVRAFTRSGLSATHHVVYGVELTDETDPTRIKIPLACSPEAVERVAQRVQELLEAE